MGKDKATKKALFITEIFTLFLIFLYYFNILDYFLYPILIGLPIGFLWLAYSSYNKTNISSKQNKKQSQEEFKSERIYSKEDRTFSKEEALKRNKKPSLFANMTKAEIKEKYRELAKKYHPDKAPKGLENEFKEIMQKINDEYALALKNL